MGKCPNCGEKLSAETEYCPSCGAYTRELTPEDLKEIERAKSQLSAEDLAKSVVEELEAGIPKADIIKRLSDSGLETKEAEEFVNHIDMLRFEARKDAATKDLGCGFLLFIVGAAITIGTWAAAEGGGSYWVMWGAMLFGAFYILRGLYRKITSSTESGTRFMWSILGILLFGGVIGGGLLISNIVTESEISVPSNEFVVFEDNCYWYDEINSIFHAGGIVRNTHSEWTIKNVEIEVRALDDNDNALSTHKVLVVPSTLRPGEKGIFSQRLQFPIACTYAEYGVLWEWVPP